MNPRVLRTCATQRMTIPANTKQLFSIHSLAEKIWPIVYKEMLSEKQIRLMLDEIYSPEALFEASQNGECFFLHLHQDCPVAFISLKEKTKRVRLEKLYILPEHQRKGIGKQLICFVEKHAQTRGYTEIELNVNRRNPAYYFYLKNGFKVHQEINIPYHSYVLDDYIMRKTISLQN